MKRMSHPILIGAITLLVLSSACNMPAQLPSVPSETLSAAGQFTSTPISIDIITQTPALAIPITGLDVVSLQCQFCVNDEVHAVLVMSDQAFFNVADPNTGVTCLSAKELDGHRILLCRGAQQASFTLNVCVDTDNCLQFPITLQRCPLIPATGAGTASPTLPPVTPVILTPRNTLIPATDAPSTPAPTNPGGTTPLPTSATIPPTLATSTPVPPATQPPTTEPPPTQPSTTEPPPTDPPTVEPTDEPPAPTETGSEDDDRIVICHISPGNPDQRRTMTVSRSDWEEEHSQHGDSRGAC